MEEYQQSTSAYFIYYIYHQHQQCVTNEKWKSERGSQQSTSADIHKERGKKEQGHVFGEGTGFTSMFLVRVGLVGWRIIYEIS